MKKMEFMQYTATEVAAYCGTLYKLNKITNFIVKCEYTRVLIRIKTRYGTIELVFYSSGRIIAKGYASDGFKFETSYYEWTKYTATEEIAKDLSISLLSAALAENFSDTANCFHSDEY